MVPWGAVNCVPLESQCFPRRNRAGRQRDSRETKFTVPLGPVTKANFEKHSEIPGTTSGHLQLSAPSDHV